MSRANRMLIVNADLAGGGLLLGIALVALVLARGGTFQVWIYPRVVAGFLAIMGLGLLVKAFVRPQYVEVFDKRTAATTVLPFAVGIVVYGLLFSRAGFVPTTIVMYGAAMFVLRGRFTLRSAAFSLAVGAVFTLILHQVFTRTFFVPLPRGTWW